MTIHDLDFLDHPERTRAEIRRDYPALCRAHAGRPIRSSSSRNTPRTTSRRGSASRVSASPSARRARRPGRGATRASRQAGASCFSARSSRARTSACCSTPTSACSRAMPAAPPLVLAGRVTPEAESTRRPRPPARRWPVVSMSRLRRCPNTGEPLFQRALVFVMPSHTEGFGMPALEAMTAGVPVIAANRGALPRGRRRAGRLVDPDDPDATRRCAPTRCSTSRSCGAG